MDYAKTDKDGNVVALIRWDGRQVLPETESGIQYIKARDGVQPGWRFVAGVFCAPQPDVPALMTEARKSKHADINDWRKVEEMVGAWFSFNGNQWDGDTDSARRLALFVAADAAGEFPSDFYWTSADNQDVPMTASELNGLQSAMLTAMASRLFNIHERQRQMKSEVEQLNTLEAIRHYKVGWPAPQALTES